MEYIMKISDGEVVFQNSGAGISIAGGYLGELKILPSPLFRIRLKDVRTNQSHWISSAEGWEKAGISGDGFEFQLENHADAPGISVLVSCKQEETSLLFDMEIINQNDHLSIMDASYPTPALSAEYFDVLYPCASGSVARDAGKKGLSYSKPYPSDMACMQYFAAYTRTGGVYIGIEDPATATKSFDVCANDDQVTFELLCHAENGGKAKNTFHLFGKCRWQVFEGDWFEASKIYLKFLKDNCDWLPVLGEDGRKDLPERFKDVPFWVSDYIPNTEYQRENKPMSLSAGSDIYSPDYWINAAIELKNQLDVNVAYHVYNWHHIPFNIEYPHFLPAKDVFFEGAQKLRKEGIALLPYINAVSWETRDGEMGHTMNFDNTGIHGAVIEEDGSVLTCSYPQTTCSGHTSELAPICPDFKPWIDHMRDLSREMLSDLPIDGIYYDQIAAVPSSLCCNPEHSHPSYGGTYWVDGYRKMMDTINAEKPQDKYYFTECNAEPYISQFDGFLTWMWVHGDQVPAFSAVYGGYIQLVGRFTIGKKKDDFEFFKYNVTQCLHYGQIMGWCKADIIYSEKHMQFLKPLVDVRKRYNRFFVNAEMLKPPAVLCDLPDQVTGPALAFKKDVIMPQVNASVWKNRKSGKKVLFITNIADKQAEIKLSLHLSHHDISKDQLPEGFVLAGETAVLSTTMNSWECRVIEF